MRYLALVALVATPVWAQAVDVSDLLESLDETIVSGASRTAEKANDAPATSTSVSADDLRRYGLRTVGEAINFLSLGMLTADPLHSIEAGSRGVLRHADYGNHLVVMVDGHLFNESWDGTAYFEQGLGVPLELIDRIELIVGPGSVNYGSYAMLGVINIITRRAKDVGVAEATLEGTLVPGQDAQATPLLSGFGGSGRASLLLSHERTLLRWPFEVLLGLEYFAHQGQSLTFALVKGLTETDGTSTWAANWGVHPKGTYGGSTSMWYTHVPSAVLKMRWGDFEVWARAALYSRASPAMGSFGVIVANFGSNSFERDRFLDFELRWHRTLTSRLTLTVRAYLDLYDYFEDQLVSTWATNGSGKTLNVDVTNFDFRSQQLGASQWGGAELQSTVDWLGDGRFPLSVGVDVRGRAFQSSTPYVTVDGAALDVVGAYVATEWLVAPYLQQRANPWPWLHLNAGVRLDAQTGFAPMPSPRAAVVVSAPWQGHFKAMFSSAFRTPSGFERFTEVPGFVERNPALVPEHVYTGELSYEQRLGRHRVLVVGFVSRYEHIVNFVAAPDGSGAFWNTNEGSMLNEGGSALLEGVIGPWGYGVAFTAAVNQADEPLVASPNWFGNARVSFDAGARGRYALTAFFTGPRLIDVAASTSTDADGNEVGWLPSQRSVGPHLELRLTADYPVTPIDWLSARVTVAGTVDPFSPYAVGPIQAPIVGQPMVGPMLTPNTRLFLMVTLSARTLPQR